MGFLKDISKIKKQAKELDKTFDPGAQMRQAKEAMAAAGQMMEQQTAAAQLAQSGESATAQVIATKDTGTFTNMQPVLEMSFLISVSGRPPYPVTLRQVVPLAQIARLTPGSNLHVKVDPAQPELVWIDWAAS